MRPEPLCEIVRHEMCRWLAYSGSPVLLEELLYGPNNSLIVQSLHSQLGAEETNGDGRWLWMHNGLIQDSHVVKRQPGRDELHPFTPDLEFAGAAR
jgi:hypothetical protein